MASLFRVSLLSAPLLLLLVASNAEITMKPIECPESLPRWACVGAPAFAPSFHRHPTPTTSRRMPGLLPLEETVAYVQDLLQMAIEVEHSTIPLYLTTLYSIRNQSSFAASTIKSVVMEEMLHMVHAANVLNAIGGTPFIDKPEFIPQYPLVVPLINVSADIVWLTKSSIEHYHVLESTPPGGYNASISAAYLKIVDLLAALCTQHGEKAGKGGRPGVTYTLVAVCCCGVLGRT